VVAGTCAVVPGTEVRDDHPLGPYAQRDCCESWPLVPEDEWARNDGMRCWTERGKDLERFQRDYWALNRTFNPTEFDPGSWADAAVSAGLRHEPPSVAGVGEEKGRP